MSVRGNSSWLIGYSLNRDNRDSPTGIPFFVLARGGGGLAAGLAFCKGKGTIGPACRRFCKWLAARVLRGRAVWRCGTACFGPPKRPYCRAASAVLQPRLALLACLVTIFPNAPSLPGLPMPAPAAPVAPLSCPSGEAVETILPFVPLSGIKSLTLHQDAGSDGRLGQNQAVPV